MNKKIVRAGIVGSGFAAKFHYDALQRVYCANIDIARGYSTTAGKSSQFHGSQES
jgi:hypothetical protein